MKLGVIKELSNNESRVALIPQHIPLLIKQGYEIFIEKEAGKTANIADELYIEKGAKIIDSRLDLIQQVDVLLTVRFGASDEHSESAIKNMRQNQIVIGMMEPYQVHPSFNLMKEKGITSFSMELIPRTTRAQSMDVLSSMANLAGYASVIIGGMHSTKIMPMMMTAAGTIPPAQVFVLGVGVSGLQAIATAKRLGAVVSAYDVRSEVKEQVESLGAKFVILDIEHVTSEGGYAKAMDEAYYQKQRELMKVELANKDIVITTANIPGKKAPILITEDMVKAMSLGSVIVDLAAERGGNCELTEPGKTITKHGVTISGPLNVAANFSSNASMLYSKNITSFLSNLWVKNEIGTINWEDDIVNATVITKDKEIPNERTRSWIGDHTK